MRLLVSKRSLNISICEWSIKSACTISGSLLVRNLELPNECEPNLKPTAGYWSRRTKQALERVQIRFFKRSQRRGRILCFAGRDGERESQCLKQNTGSESKFSKAQELINYEMKCSCIMELSQLLQELAFHPSQCTCSVQWFCSLAKYFLPEE